MQFLIDFKEFAVVSPKIINFKLIYKWRSYGITIIQKNCDKVTKKDVLKYSVLDYLRTSFFIKASQIIYKNNTNLIRS